jgi:hypothetical protein
MKLIPALIFVLTIISVRASLLYGLADLGQSNSSITEDLDKD